MATLREYEPGEVILRQDDDGDSAYTIVSGSVQVTRKVQGEVIDLGHIGPGEIFGEMGIIDDRPRSATVTAVGPTTVREIHREAFLESVQSHPEIAMSLLRSIFERLRQAHTTIARLQSSIHPKAAANVRPSTPAKEPTSIRGARVFIEGITSHAIASLPENPFEISRFPFRVGRTTRDPLAHNDLSLADEEPLQVSRHHIAFISDNDHLGVIDRGSRLGAIVNGEQLGGTEGYPGPIYLDKTESELVLGSPESPFQFKVRIESEDERSS